MKNSCRIVTGTWMLTLAMVSVLVLHASVAGAKSLEWTGAGASPMWADPINWKPHFAPQPGDDLTFVFSTKYAAAVNQLPDHTAFQSISFAGDVGYKLVGNPFKVLGSITANHLAGTSEIANDLEIVGTGMVFSSAHKGAILKFSGMTIQTIPQLELAISGDGDVEIESQIIKCQGCVIPFVKAGNGTLIFKGPGGDNIPLTILSGTVLANYGSVQIANDFLLKGGTLGGNSIVGSITAGAGTVNPGVAGAGTLKATGNVILDTASTLDVSIGDSAFTQLFVSGSITVNNPTLKVTMVKGYEPPIGYQYAVLWNATPNPISGTFRGITEGGVIQVGKSYFSVTYKGGEGSGTSVVLQAVEAPKEPPQQVIPGPVPQSEPVTPPTVSSGTPQSDERALPETSSGANASGGCSLIVR